MEVIETKYSVKWCCDELGDAYINLIPMFYDIKIKYSNKKDSRTLVMVMGCPCCSHDELLEQALKMENAVLVTPFKGMDIGGYNIHEVDKAPPFRNPGEDDEALTIYEYKRALIATIDKALAE